MPRLALATLLLALTALPAEAGEPRRWPLWPSEVARIAEPLRAAAPDDKLRIVPESRRAAAVRELDRLPTPLATPVLLEALEDRSGSVRREALAACLERQLVACAPTARKIWQNELTDPALRIAALRVIALDPDPGRLPLFLAALRDSDEAVRAESARTFAAAIWPKEQQSAVRSNLIAKLADASPTVRRAAASGLGLLGPGDGALALGRLLVDPDPQVRTDTADALARLRDARAAPALLRALQAGDETFVSRSFLAAFAALPGPDVDADLLRLFDAPPRNLTHRSVADAIARRPTPGPALAEGLVARLRDESLRGSALDALLGLGAAARPALRAALDRGLEPPLELEVRRLLAALDPPERATMLDRPWPAQQDREAWLAALADPDPARRLRAAAALGERRPGWLPDAAAGQLARPTTADARRPWLVAVATARSWYARDPATVARLSAWADDRWLASGDRCLALAALVRLRPDRGLPHWRHPFTVLDAAMELIERLAADLNPAVRACAAGELAWLAPKTADPLLAAALHDPSARVRTAGALALACRVTQPDELRSMLAVLAVRDPEPAVARAAALAGGAGRRCGRWAVLVVPEGAGPFAALRWREREILAPADTLGAVRIVSGPGLDDAAPLRPPNAPPVEQTPARFFGD